MRSHRRGILALLLAAIGPGLGASPAAAGYLSLYRSSMPYFQDLVGSSSDWYGTRASVASADFNGDGYPDLAVSNEFPLTPFGLPHTISVFYHAGTRYVPSIDFWTSSTQDNDLPPLDGVHYDYTVEPTDPYGRIRLKAADLNGDGRPDLVAATGTGIALLLNTGATGVSGAQFRPAARRSHPIENVDVADFDNDGVPEIIGTEVYSGNLKVQTFHVVADTLKELASTLVYVGTPTLSPALELADVTGDGHKDVVIGYDFAQDECGLVSIFILSQYFLGAFVNETNTFFMGEGKSPNSDGYLAVASLNGDASLDIATVASCANALFIRMGHGDGTFDPVVTVPLPHAGDRVRAGDLDGDGDTDLVTIASPSGDSGYFMSGSVCVLKGNGDGTFAAPTLYGGVPISGQVLLEDINRDGRLDLVNAQAGGYFKPDVWHATAFLLNDGSGGFRTGTGSPISQHSYRQVVADFNGDGKPDVASSGASEVTIGFGNGAGTFTPGPSFAVTRPTTLAAGDINRDGKVDLLVQSGDQFVDHSFARYQGNGDGTFTQVGVTFGGLLYPRSIADVTRDGIPDIVASDGSQNIRVYVQNTFGFFTVNQFATSNSAPADIAIGDWTRDGFPDIAVASDTGIYAHASTGLATWSTGIPLWGARFTGVCVSDFNRDGYPDLAGRLDTSGASGPDGIHIFLNGPGGLQPGTLSSVQSTVEKRGLYLDTWDANIDGIPDLITSGMNTASYAPTFNTVDVLLGNGIGAFGLRTSYEIGGYIDKTATTLSTSGPRVTAGDVNRDGIPDLMAGVQTTADSSQVYTVLSSPPAFSATLHDAVFKTTLSNPKDVAVGDLDRDGKVDVVTGTEGSNPGIAVHRGGGGGSIGSATTLAQSWYGTRVRLADLNRDGILDIIGASSVAGARRVYTMLGTGSLTFGSRLDYALNVGSDIEVGDMNRDGIPDVVVATPDSVRVLTGTGTGTFTAFSGVPLASPIHDIDLADLNRDGVLDVLCANGTVSVIYGNSNGTLGTPVTTPIQSQTCQVVCAGDLNRDGFLDIVANQGTGYFVAFGAATLPFGSVFLTSLSATAFDMEIAPMAANGLPYLVASCWLDQVEVSSVGAFGALTSVGIYPVSSTPESEVLADMDRDGLLDVVSVGSGGSTVAINLRGTGTITAVEPSEAPAPRVAQLHQNYPNPFNPRTTIRFSLPDAQKVRLTVHDAQGRLVATLASQQLAAGQHEVPWHGKNSEGHSVASGVYFYRLATDDGAVKSRRMVLLK